MLSSLFFFLLRLVLATIFVGALIIALQDFIIFPSFTSSLFGSKERDPATLPKEIESTFLTTEDGKRIEAWYLESKKETAANDYIAIIFHGNGGTVEGFFSYQQWFQGLGISSYDFDYRGYGKSNGWPSEKGIYYDAEAVWKFAVQDKGIDPSNVIIFGISIGCGPAAYLASKYNAGILIFVSGYTDLVTVAKSQPLYRYLSYFLKYKFPTKEYVANLTSTCLIATHGKKDRIIPFEHLEGIEKAYKGQGGFHKIVSEKANHNNIMAFVEGKLVGKIFDCLP